MKKTHFRSALFIFITVLSIASFLFLQSQKVETNTFSEIQKVEQNDNLDDATSPVLPDAEILKEIVRKGKKYITVTL